MEFTSEECSRCINIFFLASCHFKPSKSCSNCEGGETGTVQSSFRVPPASRLEAFSIICDSSVTSYFFLEKWHWPLTSTFFLSVEVTESHEWLRLESISGHHVVRIHCSKQGHLQEVAQGCIFSFEYFQGWWLQNQPFPVRWPAFLNKNVYSYD